MKLVDETESGTADWLTQSDRFEPILTVIVNESDRGSVLIACHIIDDCLLDLVSKNCAARVTKKLFSDLTTGTGPLSSLSGKIGVLYLLGAITEQSYEAINQLRKVRNKAAHTATQFNIFDYKDNFRNSQERFGEQHALANLARRIHFRNLIHRIYNLGPVLEEKHGQNPFPDLEHCLSYVEKNSEIQNIVEAQWPRWELALLTYLIVETLHLNFRNWTERNN